MCVQEKVRKGKAMADNKQNTEQMEVVNKENLAAVWELIYSLVKVVTGEVDIKTDGTLQAQIKREAQSINLHTNELNKLKQEVKDIEAGTGPEIAKRLDGCQQNVLAVTMAVVMLQNAMIEGTTDNICVETFQNDTDIRIISGIFDAENHRLYA